MPEPREPFAIRTLSQEQAARLDELLQGSSEIPASYEGMDDNTALEVIAIIYGCPPVVARSLLNASRNSVMSDTFNPSWVDLESPPSPLPSGEVSDVTRKNL